MAASGSRDGRRCGLIAVALSGVLATASGAAAELTQVRRGELLNLLRHDCGACHGLRLRGGLGPALTRAALADRPTAALEIIVLDGLPGTPMPPWRPLLSVHEVAWLIGIIKSGLPATEDQP